MRKLFATIGVLLGVTIVASGCGGSAITTAMPQAKAGTLLRKIQDRGRLIVGVKYDTPSFGLVNPQTKEVEGFDPAIAREIAKTIFGDPSKVEFKEAVTKDRETNVANGTFDVVLATVAINDDRAKLVDFSVVYYQTGGRLLVTNDSAIKSIADLDGKKVATTTGSVFIATLGKMTKANLVQYDTQGQAAQEVLKHNIDAAVANDILLYGQALGNPGLKVVGAQFTQEYLGAEVAKGNPEFLEAVNSTIRNLKASGKWKSIWQAEVGSKFGMTTIPDPPADDWRK